MRIATVAVLSPGDMGHSVALVLKEHGLDVVTCLEGRGSETRRLAAKAGMRDLPLDEVVSAAQLVLAIVPPEFAPALADAVAQAMKRTGKTPAYADMNAIAPQTSKDIGTRITGAGALYVDAGIIGPPPTVGSPSIYVSGPDTSLLEELPGLNVIPLGPEIGRASALKMCFSAMNKGTDALLATVLTAAEGLGLGSELQAEIDRRQADLAARVTSKVPFLPLNAGRWVEEMRQIAKTLEGAGLTPGFHLAAAEAYALLAETPFAAEVRDTFDRGRTARDTARACLDLLGKEQKS